VSELIVDGKPKLLNSRYTSLLRAFDPNIWQMVVWAWRRGAGRSIVARFLEGLRLVAVAALRMC
jgi:hypothetical protein